jgi:hypothetical protein
MKRIINTIKRFVLQRALYKCEVKYIKLGVKKDKLHKTILEEIWKGKNIEQLQLKKRYMYQKRLDLIDRKYTIKNKLRLAS